MKSTGKTPVQTVVKKLKKGARKPRKSKPDISSPLAQTTRRLNIGTNPAL